MDYLMNRREEQNRRKGIITSVIMHTILLALCIIPLLTYPDPPPGQEGILVNLGGDFGQGEENAPEGEPDVAVEETPEPEPEREPEPEPEPVKEPVKEPTKVKPKPTPTKEVVTTEDPEAVALKKKKEQEAKAKADADAKAKAKADADAKAKADADAKAKALKDKLGGAFGGDTGDGKGDTNNGGNKGNEDGDPNAKNLEGLNPGKGQVDKGLSDRGVLAAPRLTDTSQKTGKVRIKVCLDGDGNVATAEYTLSGSTSSDSQLKEMAIRNARTWKFKKGEDGQCGFITYEFKVQ